jgi:hypothetical protein
MNKWRNRIAWFSLAILAAILIWIYWPRNRAVGTIEKAGGTVQYLTAPQYQGKIAITLPDTVSDDDLEYMEALDQLQPVWLQVRGHKITGRGLASLKRLTSLHGLTLNGTHIAAEDLIHLQALPELETINLEGNTISDKGLDIIKDLPNLKSVSIRGNPVTESAVQKLLAARPDLIVFSQYEPNDD